jgi:hypothetical protein
VFLFPGSGQSKILFYLPFLAREKHRPAQSTARGCLFTSTLAILSEGVILFHSGEKREKIT